jgi:hypothetical protein
LCTSASELLESLPTEQALRAWMDRLAHYAMTKHGLADALQTATTSDSDLFAQTSRMMVDALATLLDANIEAGIIRADLSPEDVLLAMSGLFHLRADDDWQARAKRLIDLLIAGIRAVPVPG